MIRGFVASAFDLFHPGHLVLLRRCKEFCDHLIVGLHVNPALERKGKNKPVQSLIERQIQLKGCSYIDEIVVYQTEEELQTLLHVLDLDYRFLGDEYKQRDDVTGKDIVPIQYIARDHKWSSTELRERIQHARHK